MPAPTFTLDEFMAMTAVATATPSGVTTAVLPRRLRDTLQVDDDAGVARWARRMRGIHDAMTAAERNDPTGLNSDRRRRIARGAGVAITDVSRMIRMFELTRDTASGAWRRPPARAGAVLGLVAGDPTNRDPSHVHPLPAPWRVRDAAIAFIVLAALVAFAWRTISA